MEIYWIREDIGVKINRLEGSCDGANVATTDKGNGPDRQTDRQTDRRRLTEAQPGMINEIHVRSARRG